MISTVCYQNKAGAKSPGAKLGMIMKLTIAFVLFLTSAINVKAYTPPVDIHGQVINQKGEPVENASILVAGTSIGTTTGSDGSFTLSIPANIKNASLQISSVGFQTKTVRIGNQTDINIVLEAVNTGLDEVVVIGYGTARKKDLTGSVSNVS